VTHAPRRICLSTFLGALLALLTGCARPAAHTSAPQSDDKVLNVFNWSDYIQPSVIADFERETGIHVNYDVFDSNEILETKLLTGHTNYDIVVPSGAFLERQLQAEIYQKLDKSLLPNLKNVDPAVARDEALYDPGNQYSVDYMWITSGVGYNAGEIKRRMPDAPLDSWRMVFDPAVASKFADCGISVLDAPSEVVATVLLYIGRNPNSNSPEDLKAAEQVLKAVRPYIRYIDSSRYIDNLANGDICLVMGWSGDIKQAHDRAKEAAKGIDIVYSIPREGAIVNYDVIAVPADAPHVRNAHLFITCCAPGCGGIPAHRTANAVSPALQPLGPSVRNDPGCSRRCARLTPGHVRGYQRLLTHVDPGKPERTPNHT
jgi:putrescine transport system substrate-binding protein